MARLAKSYEVLPLKQENYEEWLAFWPIYVGTVSPCPARDILDNTWQRLMDKMQENMQGYGLYETSSGKFCGFVHLVFHPTTFHDGPSMCIHDAYVIPEKRSKGLLYLAYAHCLNLAKERDCAKIYWITEQKNKVAQKFYDRIASREKWYFYEIKRDEFIKE